MNTKIIQKHIKNNLDGAVQKFLPLESLRNFPILDYDIKYKNIIDLLSKIDEQISFNINLNKEITNNISIFFNYWFRQFEFPNQNNKPYKSNGGDFIWNDEFRVNIPKEWKFETIENAYSDNSKIIVADKEHPLTLLVDDTSAKKKKFPIETKSTKVEK